MFIRRALPALFAVSLVTGVSAQEANIAVAAAITATPEVEGSAALAQDGNPASALTFAVGTVGEGVITLTFDAPREVTGVRFYQPSGVYYTTRYVLEADGDGSGAFGMVLAEGDAAPVKEWVEHRFPAVTLRALRFRSVVGVSNGRRAHPCLGEFVVLGKPLPEDLAKAAERGIAVPNVLSVRPLRRATPLVVEGKAPAVLLPNVRGYEQAAGELLRGLAAIKPEQARTIEEADPAHRTVICLGNMTNNPLLERLYWNQYTYVDAVTPGQGSYLLHVVSDPYPWNGGQDVIVIGCSDPAGAAAGVRAFLSRVPDGALPHLVEGGPRPLVSDEEARKVAATAPSPTFTDFTNAARKYLQTGGEAYARKAVATLDIVTALYAPGGVRGNPEAHSAQVLPWNEETTSFDILCAWDAFEECPLLSDAQRLAATNALLKFTRDLVGNCSTFGSLGQGDTITWNHTTFPLLGIYGGARYFNRYYPLADMPEKLSKARACFLAQARSWKPEEDSDAYVIYVPDHTAKYCLAEGEMAYFASGNLKRFADYLVGICDNRGLASGFGDSGLSSLPDIPMDALPLALWHTGDGGYRWLAERYTNGAWKNPWERGVKAARPDRFTGVNVFPLDRQVYEYHQKYPSYNEKLVPAEVPVEHAFDKISFRDSWDLDAQYLLLDGFGRGKHLHYDTNAIIEFVEGSERWLLDHDYLVRNTTEHAMLTVLREGRADALAPSMAGLTAHADLPGLGYADTYVKGYNGCDWRRQVLWNRGECFLVVDTVRPREAGSYDLELTWKTADESGHQRIEGGHDFVAERGVGQAETGDCARLDDPEASGGKALVLDRASSRVALGVDLPPGEYALGIHGYGVDTSSDSVWVSVDLGPKTAFHLPLHKYGVSGSSSGAANATPTVKLEGKGPHLVVITLREDPPVRLDKVVLTDAAGKETIYEAEALPPAPKPDKDLTRAFHIKPATPVQAWVTNHERIGISVPVSVLHQRHSASLQAEQAVQFASLLYTSLPRRRRDLAPVQLQENLIAIQGTDPGLAVTGPVGSDIFTITAAAGWLTPQRLELAGLRRLELGDLELHAGEALDLRLDLRTGLATVWSEPGAELRYSLGKAGRAYRLEQPTTEFRLEGAFPAKEVIRRIERLLGRRPGGASGAPAAGASLVTAPVWSALEGPGEINCLKTLDLHDGVGPRLLVGRGAVVHCLDASGKQLWDFTCQGLVRDLAAGDLRPAPGDEIVVGSADTYAYVLSATGQLLDRKQMRGTPWARSFGDQAYAVWNVGVWDVNADGRPEVVVTLRNFDVQVYDADWKLLWKNDYALHGSTHLSFEDADRDGRGDTLFIGDRYGSIVAADSAGQRAFSVYTSIGDMACALGDVDGDGKLEVVAGSSTGDLVCVRYPDGGEQLWRFDNFGYPVQALRCADLNGDGRDEVIVASGTGYLYVLGDKGQVLWQDRAGLTVNDILVTGASTLAYADQSGLLRLTDGQGRAVQDLWPGSPPRRLTTIAGPAGPLIVAALDSGQVVAYPVR